METLKNDFETKKRKYFINLGTTVLEALKLHKEHGLWGSKGTREDWRNVTKHCLVEVARGKVLGDILELPDEVKQNLILAAAAHDFNKIAEKAASKREGGITWESTEESSRGGDERMRAAGISEEVIALVNSVAHTSLETTAELLKKETLAPDEIAYLVMHYLDDYTIEDTWAEEPKMVGDRMENALNQRVRKNKENPQYANIDEAGKSRFGMSSYDYQLQVGEQVEERLAKMVSEKIGREVPAKSLPVFIDSLIKEEIEKQ